MDLIFFPFLNFLPGVYSVNVEPEKKLVTVVGNIDPMILITGIERWIGSAELLYYQKNRKVGDDHGDKEEAEEEFRSSMNGKAKSHEGDHSEKERVRETERERNHGSSKAAKHKKKKKKKKADDGHVIEPYEPPKIDPTICRDPYCKLHKLRPIFHSKVPSRHSADHPHHTDGYSFPTRLGSRSSVFDGPFPYDHTMMEPPLLPPSSFGYHPGTSYIPGFDNFSCHDGDAAAYFRGRYM